MNCGDVEMYRISTIRIARRRVLVGPVFGNVCRMSMVCIRSFEKMVRSPAYLLNRMSTRVVWNGHVFKVRPKTKVRRSKGPLGSVANGVQHDGYFVGPLVGHVRM